MWLSKQDWTEISGCIEAMKYWQIVINFVWTASIVSSLVHWASTLADLLERGHCADESAIIRAYIDSHHAWDQKKYPPLCSSFVLGEFFRNGCTTAVYKSWNTDPNAMSNYVILISEDMRARISKMKALQGISGGVNEIVCVENHVYGSNFTAIVELQLNNETLKDIVVKKDWHYFTYAQRIRTWIQLLQTLKEVHARDVIHGDIKRTNIMFNSSDHAFPVLIDFGMEVVDDCKKKDDLLSLGYKMLSTLDLVWSGVQHSPKEKACWLQPSDRKNSIVAKHEESQIRHFQERYLKLLNENISTYFKYLYQMNDNDKIDYNYLMQLIEQLF